MSHLLSVDDDIYEPRMPEVDVLADIEKIFVEAQRAAGQNGVDGKSRNVVVVTPGDATLAAAWLPETPCPLATDPACEAPLGTPGNAPPACARSRFHSEISGL